MSVVAFGFRSDMDNARNEMFEMGKLCGCPDDISSKELIACLRDQSEDDILRFGLQVIIVIKKKNEGNPISDATCTQFVCLFYQAPSSIHILNMLLYARIMYSMIFSVLIQ